jgi:hypothetical protein
MSAMPKATNRKGAAMNNRPPVGTPGVPVVCRLLFACALAASLALSACGGGGPASAATKSPADNALKFSRCMREHGIPNFPDPEVSGNGMVRLKFSATPGKLSPQTMEAAQRACQRYQASEQQNLTPQQRVEREEAGLKFAKCMREHGINLPNPTTSGGGIKIQVGPGPGAGGPNPSSPAFEAAQKACQGLLPKLKGGPGPRTSSSGGAGAGLSLSSGG